MYRLWGHFSGRRFRLSGFSTFDRFEYVTALFLAKFLVHALDVPIDVGLEEGQRSGPLTQHLVVEVLETKSLPQGLFSLVAQLN